MKRHGRVGTPGTGRRHGPLPALQGVDRPGWPHTEEQEQASRLWEAATVEELRQVRDILAAVQARLGRAEGRPETAG
jgi:hypothetical protein